MLYVVYIQSDPDFDYKTVLGIFLMKEDAELFMSKSIVKNLKITEVESWGEWTAIRGKAGLL